MRNHKNELRKILEKELHSIPGISITKSDGTFYALIDVSNYGSCEEVAKSLLEKSNIVTVPGSVYGKSTSNYLRLSFAMKEKQLKDGIYALKDWIEKVNK